MQCVLRTMRRGGAAWHTLSRVACASAKIAAAASPKTSSWSLQHLAPVLQCQQACLPFCQEHTALAVQALSSAKESGSRRVQQTVRSGCQRKQGRHVRGYSGHHYSINLVTNITSHPPFLPLKHLTARHETTSESGGFQSQASQASRACVAPQCMTQRIYLFRSPHDAI